MRKTKTITTQQWIQAGLIATIASSLYISNLFAFEASIEQSPRQIPTIAVNEASEPAKQDPQAPIDFFSNESPLSKPSNHKDTSNLTFEEVFGQGQQCSATGGASLGSQSCLIRNQDGSFSEVETHWEKLGKDLKKQIITKNYNDRGDQVSEETVRIKAHHMTLDNGVEVLKKETIDIVKQSIHGKTSRDLVVKNYEKGELVKTTWAHYIEDPKVGTLKASIDHHAVLYHNKGQLTAGFANKYKNGKIEDVLLNFNPKRNPNLHTELSKITTWAKWIDQLTQAPLAAI